ncbi:MAG TPA: 4-hydroxy-3-methylbut-2-enyl diphosphate reductase [Balneolales bacterium]|nr:4-hydroxy-3-methylbut-2-enyl diphosphate reductase [Balneolales bacterium]
MAKKFNIPEIYKSPIIRNVKESQQILDPRKKDLTPSVLDFGPVRFLIPRHFGFCYGVQNAIDIAYRTIEKNPGHNIYLLSEMIHNPNVNRDLSKKGVKFLFDTDGTNHIPLDSLQPDDIVIVPAFGTTLEIQTELEERGIDPYTYDTTCPFVEKVWKRGNQLGKKGYAIVVHGKHRHEETRATFSHSSRIAPTIVVLNIEEARLLADFMLGKKPIEEFGQHFGMKCTPGFDPRTDMQRFGVINQTTMLATETQQVMDILKQAAVEKYGEEEITDHFADTSDTLCYATNENQSATRALMEEAADVALVVGGYNSSNTMHIVELLEQQFPAYHVRDASELYSKKEIHHFSQWDKEIKATTDWLPDGKPVTVAVTSGASCPDVLVDEVILKIVSWFENTKTVEEALKPFQDNVGA